MSGDSDSGAAGAGLGVGEGEGGESLAQLKNKSDLSYEAAGKSMGGWVSGWMGRGVDGWVGR